MNYLDSGNDFNVDFIGDNNDHYKTDEYGDHIIDVNNSGRNTEQVEVPVSIRFTHPEPKR